MSSGGVENLTIDSSNFSLTQEDSPVSGSDLILGNVNSVSVTNNKFTGGVVGNTSTSLLSGTANLVLTGNNYANTLNTTKIADSTGNVLKVITNNLGVIDNKNIIEVGSGKPIKQYGLAVSVTLVFVDIPIDSYYSPVSISSTGSFNIVDVNTGTTITSGVTPAFSTISHSKNAVLQFAVTGATRGGIYRAVAASNSSITIEF